MSKNPVLRQNGCRVLGQVIISVMFLASAVASAQNNFEDCGSLQNNFHDPFDYTNYDPEHLQAVEGHHFTLEVETLVGHEKCGRDRCNLANDIDYTLRQYPNHYRALATMVNYHLRGYDKTLRPMRYTPTCYFDRAFRWRPGDPVLHMIFGHYLHKIGKSEQALQQYKEALALAPNSSEVNYNLGLLYAQMEEYALAREYAQKAYSAGFPLPGLRSILQRAGEWEEPQEVVAEDVE